MTADEPIVAAKFFRSNLLVYPHVEKTGGSFFVVAAKQIFGDDRVYDMRGGHPKPADMEPRDMQRTWVLSGHFWYDTQERPFARRKQYLMSIRDPVDRYLSYYNYVAAAKDHPGHNKYGVLDISDAFEYLVKHNPNAVFNRFCAMFGERKPAASPREPGKVLRARAPVSFEEAKSKIEATFALVIPMKRAGEAMIGLADAFGAPYTPIDRVNVAVVKKAARVPDDIRDEIIRRNDQDQKLIDFYNSVFDERLANLRQRLLDPPPAPPIARIAPAAKPGASGIRRALSRIVSNGAKA